MRSLERKQELSFEHCMPPAYPTIYVCDEQMPEIAELEPEAEITMTVKMRVKSRNQNATIKGTDTDSCLELLAYEVKE